MKFILGYHIYVVTWTYGYFREERAQRTARLQLRIAICSPR